MELDDFKTVWKKDDNINITRESLQQRINQVEKSGKKIRRAFVTELTILAVMYLFFIGMIVIFHGQIQSFIYKLVAITLIGFLPLTRLYKSQSRINSINYATDIRSNLLSFLTYYKTTLKWYWWSSIIISALIFIMLFTDKDFLELEIEWKMGICAYILLVLLLARLYLKKGYGQHVKEFENFLK